MKYQLDNKTVIVTGASSGIGKALTGLLIGRHHCNVIGIGRNEEKMLEFSKSLGEYEKNFTYRLFDVSVEENWKGFLNWLNENNIKPDLLINNAGVLPKFNRFGEYDIEQIKWCMDINFYSAVYSCHYLLPLLLEGGQGGIVNISSSASLCTLPGTSVYSASKSAVRSLTEAIREEYKGRLYVTVVCPGFTKTNIFSNQGIEPKGSKIAQKAFDFIIMPCEKMAGKILSGIENGREKMVFGIDSHLMDAGNKAFGVLTGRISGKVMKKSGYSLFADVFK